MNRLNRRFLESQPSLPAELHVAPQRASALPERVLQFGEGNFLRGFVDWMIHRMNCQGLFGGRVIVVQPIAQGMVDRLKGQDGLYTLLLRGIEEGKVVERMELVESISRGIDPYRDFEAFLGCAELPELRFVVSNTTEAGIAFREADRPTDRPPESFPGKLTLLLKRRFDAFAGDPAKGFMILPCELIEHNGRALKQAVLQTANHFGFPVEFLTWIDQANQFASTLVDRIVTGYPRDEAAAITQRLGYEDALLDTGEIFHLWVIEADRQLAQELPLAEAGLDVIFTPDQTPYRARKVRILNGAHTMTVLAAFLAGLDTVRQCMDDPLVRAYMIEGIREEILPTLDLPQAELEDFAARVVERFSNPFIEHRLLSIALNSTSKFKARVLPSIEAYLARRGTLPRRLAFSLAAQIAFYRGTTLRGPALVGVRNGEEYSIQDDMRVLELFQKLWTDWDRTPADLGPLVQKVLAQADLWGKDLNGLPGLTAAVTAGLQKILSSGVRDTLAEMVDS